jgi:3-deoxy-7-phosphoheptulonate synthase
MRIRKIFSQKELKLKLKLDFISQKNIFINREEIKKIISGVSNKFIVIIGPCSVYDCDAMLRYVNMILSIYKYINKKIFIILRVFTVKSRSDLNKFKGLVHQIDINKSESIYDGLIAERKIILDIIKNSGLAIANEIVYPEIFNYTNDLISYYVLGARSMNSQTHKIFVSNLNICVGIKNPLDGDLNVLFKSLIATQTSHNFLFDSYEVKTNGNLFSHVILRGIEINSKYYPNYHYENILDTINLYPNLTNKAIIIDASHANSQKKYLEQIRIVKEILFNRKNDKIIKKFVRGVMIESFIESGSQETNKIFGKSITDPCLSFEQTKNLLEYVFENV